MFTNKIYEIEIRPTIKIEVSGMDDAEALDKAQDRFYSKDVMSAIESRLRGVIDYPVDMEITAETE
jgi:hypothetical protein